MLQKSPNLLTHNSAPRMMSFKTEGEINTFPDIQKQQTHTTRNINKSPYTEGWWHQMALWTYQKTREFTKTCNYMEV